ncbi:methyltransferase domain-containing protein [bacterium]|nr:methyltransferase domain-containing protein [candidate division CSSED10-310 bacterium]
MNPTALPPDKYQRYRQAAQIIHANCDMQSAVSILDIGASENLLAMFLPGANVIQLDKSPGKNSKHIICGNAQQLPFSDNTFSFAIALDLLEHLPKSDRQQAVREAGRVAQNGLIIAFPVQSNTTEKLENILNAIEVSTRGQTNPFLDEHHLHGLVEEAPLIQYLKTVYPFVISLPNYNLTAWFLGSIWEEIFAMLPCSERLKVSIYELFNRLYFDTNLKHPVYRLTVVASNSQMKLPEPSDVSADLVKTAEMLQSDVTRTFESLKSLDTYARKMQLELDDSSTSRKSLENAYLRLEKEIHQKTRELSELTRSNHLLQKEYDSTKKYVEKVEIAYRHSLSLISSLEQHITDLQNELIRILTDPSGSRKSDNRDDEVP